MHTIQNERNGRTSIGSYNCARSSKQQCAKTYLGHKNNIFCRPVAGVLMTYSRGCAAVLGQMSEEEQGGNSDAATPRSTDSASDGYHSDSDDSQQHPDR